MGGETLCVCCAGMHPEGKEKRQEEGDGNGVTRPGQGGGVGNLWLSHIRDPLFAQVPSSASPVRRTRQGDDAKDPLSLGP